jgi:hypothetical protein
MVITSRHENTTIIPLQSSNYNSSLTVTEVAESKSISKRLVESIAIFFVQEIDIVELIGVVLQKDRVLKS